MLKKIYKNDIIAGTESGTAKRSVLIKGRKGQTNMSNQKQARKVYFHVLEGSRFIIADERNKKRLLDIVLDIQRQEEWAIYAFCVTDDSAFFVTEASCSSSIGRGAGRMAEQFLEKCRGTLPQLSGITPTVHPGVLEELNTLQEVAGRCRWIHRLPLDKGYVVRMIDYWWSSYITYMGQYDWEMIDCHVLTEYFSMDPEAARFRLRRFHQYCALPDITDK